MRLTWLNVGHDFVRDDGDALRGLLLGHSLKYVGSDLLFDLLRNTLVSCVRLVMCGDGRIHDEMVQLLQLGIEWHRDVKQGGWKAYVRSDMFTD